LAEEERVDTDGVRHLAGLQQLVLRLRGVLREVYAALYVHEVGTAATEVRIRLHSVRLQRLRGGEVGGDRWWVHLEEEEMAILDGVLYELREEGKDR
jgi:hypothetical protein